MPAVAYQNPPCRRRTPILKAVATAAGAQANVMQQAGDPQGLCIDEQAVEPPEVHAPQIRANGVVK
ncbi:MAG: hypothetical protein ACRELT_06270, partial [Longimicrobiales bacterium]